MCVRGFVCTTTVYVWPMFVRPMYVYTVEQLHFRITQRTARICYSILCQWGNTCVCYIRYIFIISKRNLVKPPKRNHPTVDDGWLRTSATCSVLRLAVSRRDEYFLLGNILRRTPLIADVMLAAQFGRQQPVFVHLAEPESTNYRLYWWRRLLLPGLMCGIGGRNTRPSRRRRLGWLARTAAPSSRSLGRDDSVADWFP